MNGAANACEVGDVVLGEHAIAVDLTLELLVLLNVFSDSRLMIEHDQVAVSCQRAEVKLAAKEYVFGKEPRRLKIDREPPVLLSQNFSYLVGMTEYLPLSQESVDRFLEHV